MSRLLDRLLATGCQPFRVADLFEGTPALESLGRVCERAAPKEAAASGRSTRELGEWFLHTANPTGTRRMEPSQLHGVPVIAADNVVDYCRSLPVDTQMAELVTTVAPPFGRFFVECIPSKPDTKSIVPFHSWGFFCGAADLTDPEWSSKVPDRGLAPVMRAFSDGPLPTMPTELADVTVRWVIQLILFLEVRKGRPMGPVAEFSFPLDEQGRLVGLPDGSLVGVEGIVSLSTPFLDNFAGDLIRSLDNQLMPALFAISLMHCKNVRVDQIEPPAALSRKALRRTGHPLVRYHVLEIGRMRRILDGEGGAGTKGLGHALHICRGHFKTFTEEAPLFGKHVGQYWWHDLARGSPRRGVVTSDYQVVVEDEGGEVGDQT
jgi:hypothetical protein